MNMLSNVVASIAGAVIFLLVYEFLLKNAFTYFLRFKSLKGYYIVCSQTGDEFANSPKGIPNCLIIRIKFFKPNVLITYSKDYDKHYANIWKTWSGMISMDTSFKGHGSGYYIYVEGKEPGLHEVFLRDKNTFLVRITDYGKANLKNNTDNISTLQIWKRLDKKHPKFIEIKNILKA
jgi:hypothetical protein